MEYEIITCKCQAIWEGKLLNGKLHCEIKTQQFVLASICIAKKRPCQRHPKILFSSNIKVMTFWAQIVGSRMIFKVLTSMIFEQCK